MRAAERALALIFGWLVTFLGVSDPSNVLHSSGQAVAVAFGSIVVALTHFAKAWEAQARIKNGGANGNGTGSVGQ